MLWSLQSEKKRVNYHHDMGTSDYCISNEERKFLPSVSEICIVLVRTYVSLLSLWSSWAMLIVAVFEKLKKKNSNRILVIATDGSQSIELLHIAFNLPFTSAYFRNMQNAKEARTMRRATNKKIIPAHKVYRNEIESMASLGKKIIYFSDKQNLHMLGQQTQQYCTGS